MQVGKYVCTYTDCCQCCEDHSAGCRTGLPAAVNDGPVSSALSRPARASFPQGTPTLQLRGSGDQSHDVRLAGLKTFPQGTPTLQLRGSGDQSHDVRLAGLKTFPQGTPTLQLRGTGDQSHVTAAGLKDSQGKGKLKNDCDAGSGPGQGCIKPGCVQSGATWEWGYWTSKPCLLPGKG